LKVPYLQSIRFYSSSSDIDSSISPLGSTSIKSISLVVLFSYNHSGLGDHIRNSIKQIYSGDLGVKYFINIKAVIFNIEEIIQPLSSIDKEAIKFTKNQLEKVSNELFSSDHATSDFVRNTIEQVGSIIKNLQATYERRVNVVDSKKKDNQLIITTSEVSDLLNDLVKTITPPSNVKLSFQGGASYCKDFAASFWPTNQNKDTRVVANLSHKNTSELQRDFTRITKKVKEEKTVPEVGTISSTEKIPAITTSKIKAKSTKKNANTPT